MRAPNNNLAAAHTNQSKIVWSELLGFTGIIIGAASYFIRDNHRTTSHILIAVGGLLFILAVAMFAYQKHVLSNDVNSGYRKISGLKLKYGVFWDSDLNPFCPSCEGPMHFSTDRYVYISGATPPDPELHCIKCPSSYISLYDPDTGRELTIKQARENLRKP